jgi:uncharacterized membrane protein YbhN (UPF0104 family)
MLPTILRIWRPIATVVILIVTLAGFLYYFASHPVVRQQLHHTSMLTLVVLFWLYLLVIVALSLVTLTTLRLCNIKLAPAETGLLTMYATVINFFGPLQSGPAFRGVYLKRKHGLDLKKYTLATLVFYALYGLFSGIFLLSGILGWWLLIGGAVAIVTLMYIRRSKLPLAKRFQALNLDAIYALAAATLFQLAIVAVIYFIELRSIQHGVTFGQAIIYAGAANFSLFVSLTPGAIGFRESFLLFSQRLHHISSSTIIAANIIDRSMYIVLLAVIGLVIIVTHTGRRLRAQ